jgi:hypothetical protein
MFSRGGSVTAVAAEPPMLISWDTTTADDPFFVLPLGRCDQLTALNKGRSGAAAISELQEALLSTTS